MRLLVATTAAATIVGSGVDTRAASERARSDFYLCEGCEATLERDAASLTWRADIAPPTEPGEPLILTGTVFQPDGRTPAAGVVIYAHHTNAAGVYANGTPETEWSRRHGRLRGWVRTNAEGRYEFRTIKPGPYPQRNDPAHIHLFLREPGKPPYWIDDVVFDGEFGVTDEYRRERENRGGSGIVKLERTAEGVWLARRDIVLEVHPE